MFIHPRDLARFAPGRGGTARFYNDPPPPPPPGDFKAQLPDDLRGAAYLADVKDLPTLVKNYGELMSYRGNSIRAPGPDAGDAARAEFKEKLKKMAPELVELPADPEKRKAHRKEILESLGWPKDAATEFTLDKAGVQLEAGVKLDENELRQAAVELGLDKDGFAKLVGKTAAAQAAGIKRAQAEQSVLKGEWGAAYEERRNLAVAALEKTGAPADLVEAVKNGTAPATAVKWAFGLAQSVGAEAREVAAGQRGASRPAALTPQEALAQLAEIEARPEYLNPGKAIDVHNQLVAKHTALLAFAYPELVEK